MSKIGNHDGSGTFAPNGVQTDVGLYFRGASGTVDHTDSTATGLGRVNYIAQNGIQYLDSTAPKFEHNTVTNNMYLNPADPTWNQSATGYLFLCTNVTSDQQLIKAHNTASNNDYNYYVSNSPTDC